MSEPSGNSVAANTAAPLRDPVVGAAVDDQPTAIGAAGEVRGVPHRPTGRAVDPMQPHRLGSYRDHAGSASKQPDGPFVTITVARPGELMQIDSTPLDVRVVLDDGLVDRVELTGLVDQATRTIGAAVLRPTTKAVDAALLLACTLTPEPMRPRWVDALRLTRSVLPHASVTAIDARLEHAAARPVIVPETNVCDHGKAFLSTTFRSVCRSLGISVQPAHPDTPTDSRSRSAPWGRWARCSPSTSPATSAPVWNAAAGAPSTARCGR